MQNQRVMETQGITRERKTSRFGRRKKPERSAVNPCVKLLLFFENFMLVILGLAMTALGTYILVIKDKVVRSALDFFLDPACDMCLVGAIIFVMGFLGCTGALREIVCFLKMYYYALMLMLLAQLALAVVLFVSYYVPETKEQIFPSDLFKDAILNYRNDPDMQHLIDAMHEDLQCCGLSNTEEGFLDWNTNVYFNCSETNLSPEKCSVPYSCCKRAKGDNINYQCGANMMMIAPNGAITGDNSKTDKIYQDGCIKALGDWIDQHALIVGGVMLGIVIPQVCVIVLTRNLIEMILIQKSYW